MGHSSNHSLFGKKGILQLPVELWIVLAIGLAFRLHGFIYAPVINPDGALYIQQAKALWYGLRDQLLACYSYLSIYPILIYLAKFMLNNWIIAAKGVSLFFGTLTMLPLFWLVRQFVGRSAAAFCILTLAVNPTYVVGSYSLERDPVYWFFASLGILLFVLSLKEKKPGWMILSSASLLVASWARIEAVVYITGTIIFLLFYRPFRWRELVCFAAPIVSAAVLSIGLLLVMGQAEFRLMGLSRVLGKATGALSSYNVVRGHLGQLIDHWSHRPGGYSMMHFFMRTRNLIWLIALFSVMNQIKRGFFWPAFIFFVFGLPLIRKALREQKELAYLLLLGAMAFFALYVQILSGWAMESRFIALFLMPLLVVTGFGIENLTKFMKRKFGWKEQVSLLLFAAVVLVPGIYKERRAGEDKNIILRKVGEFIANQQMGVKEVKIAGSLRRMQLIHFYANLPLPAAP
ncbi:MAG: hypothetical protein DRH12_11620, partial [Deltaproteobacteria bacterium]